MNRTITTRHLHTFSLLQNFPASVCSIFSAARLEVEVSTRSNTIFLSFVSACHRSNDQGGLDSILLTMQANPAASPPPPPLHCLSPPTSLAPCPCSTLQKLMALHVVFWEASAELQYCSGTEDI